jgi:hypothetical protein
MIAFVTLPALLILVTLVWVVASLSPVRPWLPHASEATTSQDEAARMRALAEGIAAGPVDERRKKMMTLAGETERCPGYASFSVPRLAAELKDPDDRIRAAAAYALGAMGPHASAALPSLREVHGEGHTHVDHVVAEAIWWIEHGDTVAFGEACVPLPSDLTGK